MATTARRWTRHSARISTPTPATTALWSSHPTLPTTASTPTPTAPATPVTPTMTTTPSWTATTWRRWIPCSARIWTATPAMIAPWSSRRIPLTTALTPMPMGSAMQVIPIPMATTTRTTTRRRTARRRPTHWMPDLLPSIPTATCAVTPWTTTTTTTRSWTATTARRWTRHSAGISTPTPATTALWSSHPTLPTTASTPTPTAPATPVTPTMTTTPSWTATTWLRWIPRSARTWTATPAMIAPWSSRRTPPTTVSTPMPTGSVMPVTPTRTATATPTTTRPQIAPRPPTRWMPDPLRWTPTAT